MMAQKGLFTGQIVELEPHVKFTRDRLRRIPACEPGILLTSLLVAKLARCLNEGYRDGQGIFEYRFSGK
ncbi:hypothetical protein X741_08425 [Mesorhizobium sp. LNHC229A00]|nr:hypothetical protein X741_08425 [Mesorhizobium sp. LNHC229A00]